jgi:hypothetical protein
MARGTKNSGSTKLVHAPNINLRDSAGRGELVAVIGSGVSLALTKGTVPLLSWVGLVRDGFFYAVNKKKITDEQVRAWEPQLSSLDIDDLLCAAEFVSRKLDAPHGLLYARWFEHAFKNLQPSNTKLEEAIIALHNAGVPLCTLNYDPLLEQVTGMGGINLTETGKVSAWMRREIQSILHLHGSWDVPATCILGVRDYESTLGNDVRDLIQRSLASFRRLLFIGCGGTLADPNFTALIKWLREKMKTAAPEHVGLVTDTDLAVRRADPAWQGFVEPLSYGTKFDDLATYLLKLFPAEAQRQTIQTKLKNSDSTTRGQAKIISDYLAFLLKDCGQMAIEGVRADMDIGQRKFDIERLFVPLNVVQCPPEFPMSDPKREQKLQEWAKKNSKPRPFGKVLGKHNRIALLALPGGGKTLLLKRIAVAYADPLRHRASKDYLPNIDVVPVLIRCREWREYIQSPILSILQKLPDITGDPRLKGLGDALIPLFKNGRALLLVDGLDEIHNDAHRTIFVEHLEAFVSEYMLTRLVVTSREAGFNLVAPCLSRFCDRWRVAPLDEMAITTLCDHWQALMSGDSPQARTEGRELSENLLRNTAIRRLAENPLLLTMLLVVKHGAGRLPPDRVSLYNRAVEVLLDTWNIKGHDPLNPKEAVPQLACVAFEMMRAGKQTATEKELLRLLEDARERVPQIRRYASGTPFEFLKRVELRSSLLVEAGHQIEAGRTVPFYQFRHLTFQEYLTAVAAVEGHYMEYEKTDTVLTPLCKFLLVDEWKEVIPMAAVLARKQAEPLMLALVDKASKLQVQTGGGEHNNSDKRWVYETQPSAPAPVARLIQCLVEEAEASPETLTAALRQIAVFAKGCESREDWAALSRGPYGSELFHQAWVQYATMTLPKESMIIQTMGAFAVFRYPITFWQGEAGKKEIQRLIRSTTAEDIVRGLFSFSSLARQLGHSNIKIYQLHFSNIIGDIEKHIFEDDPVIHIAAIHALTFIWYHENDQKKQLPKKKLLDRLLYLRFHSHNEFASLWSRYALSMQISLKRGNWIPTLDESQSDLIRRSFISKEKDPNFDPYLLISDIVVAFHSGTVFTDDVLAQHIISVNGSMRPGVRGELNPMLEQLGYAAGRRNSRQKDSV